MVLSVPYCKLFILDLHFFFFKSGAQLSCSQVMVSSIDLVSLTKGFNRVFAIYQLTSRLSVT